MKGDDSIVEPAPRRRLHLVEGMGVEGVGREIMQTSTKRLRLAGAVTVALAAAVLSGPALAQAGGGAGGSAVGAGGGASGGAGAGA